MVLDASLFELYATWQSSDNVDNIGIFLRWVNKVVLYGFCDIFQNQTPNFKVFNDL